MSATRQVLQAGFILHHRPYSDTSLLLEIWTRDHGRRGLIARGARRGKSPLAGLLQPFKALSLSWTGRGDLATLTGAEPRGSLPPIPGSRLISGLYLNELLYRLCQRHDPHPQLFDAYELALAALATDADETPGLRRFEKTLLAEIGYGLAVARECDSGGPIEPQQQYAYLPDRGPQAVRGQTIPRDTIVVSGRTLLAIERDAFDDIAVAGEIKRLMRGVLDYHLAGHALVSRRWRASLAQLESDDASRKDPLRPT